MNIAGRVYILDHPTQANMHVTGCGLYLGVSGIDRHVTYGLPRWLHACANSMYAASVSHEGLNEGARILYLHL